MAKKRDIDGNEEDAKESSSSPHHKKHKHKKHKKHKKKRSSHGDLGESPDYGIATSFSSEAVSSDSTGKPTLKLKIKFGGQTFGTKNVDRHTIPESSSEEEEEEDDDEDEEIMVDEEIDDEDEEEELDAFSWHDETPPASLNQSIAGSERGSERSEGPKDEEEAWLDALEAGELDEYGEIKKHKDPSMLTARQKALLHGITYEDRQLSQIPNMSNISAIPTEITTEMLEKRAQKAQQRRVQAKKKVEESKKLTIERLLKKQDAKSKGLKARSKRQNNTPCISYVNSTNGITLSYPQGRAFPMAKSTAPPLKPKMMCGVAGCTNPKSYSCSKTGIPLCSLECYKKNLSTAIIVPCIS